MLRRAQTERAVMPRRLRPTGLLVVIVAWQVVLVVAVVLVAQRHVWSIALAALVLLAALLLTVPANGRTLLAGMRVRHHYGKRQRTRVAEPDQPPGLVPLAQWVPGLRLTQITDAHDTEIGVIADRESWTSVLALPSDEALFTDRGALLDVAGLARLLQQDDVVFAGIQVLTLTIAAPSGAMLPPRSPALEAYHEITHGEPVPPALRRTWIALRLDPRLCLEAVGRRGEGTVGVFATLRFGLHRAQAALKRQGVLTEPLRSLGIAEAIELTTAAVPGATGPRSAEHWEHWLCDGLYHRTRAVRGLSGNPRRGHQSLLRIASTAPAMMALTSWTISPAAPVSGAIRLVAATPEQSVEADDFLRQHLDEALPLAPLGGVQVPGLLATVPLGRRMT